MYILEELWWDYEAEKTGHEHSTEYKKRQKVLCRAEERFEEALPRELKKQFEEVTEAEWSLCAETECEAFIRGVRCGGKLLLDILA